jgi:hypothetical protein
MLSKIKTGTLRSRWGVAALAVAVPLAIPVAASAATFQGPLPGYSIPFSPWNHGAQTYNNVAQAGTMQNGHTDFTVKFQLDQSSAPRLNASNSAKVTTFACRDCNANAIAFQIVYVSEANLVALNVSNTTNEQSLLCVRCNELAEAYQFIVADDSPTPLSTPQVQQLDAICTQLEALRTSSLSDSQIEAETNSLASQVSTILADPPITVPLVTPATSNSAQPGKFTGTNRNIVDLFRSIKFS